MKVILPLSVPDEGYFRKATCALMLISPIVLLSLGRHLCWWSISPKGYHPPKVSTDRLYYYPWVDTSAGGVLVQTGKIHPKVSTDRFYYYHWVVTSAGGVLVQRGIIHPKVSTDRFYYYHWVDTSAGGVLVQRGIIHPKSQY
jgi:hypothetical protein